MNTPMDIFKEKKYEFEKVYKKITVRAIKNENKLNQYKKETQVTYNDLISCTISIYGKLSSETKESVKKELSKVLTKLKTCYDKLNITDPIPNKYSTLIQIHDENTIIESEDSENEIEEDNSPNENNFLVDSTLPNTSNIPNTGARGDIEPNLIHSEESGISDTLLGSIEFNSDQLGSTNSLNNFSSENTITDESEQNQSTMTETKVEYLKFVSKQISKFDGNPLKLNSFLLEVQLTKSVTDQANLPLLKQFIMTKLEGKALESVPINPETIDEIVDALKENIKPMSSKVIEGRMLSLKSNHNFIQDYTKQAEELAEAFQRALIDEGIPQPKAKEMTIDRTVEMCRSNAKNDLVKTILAASTFNDSRDVVAKFVVESTSATKDCQILTFKSNRNNNKFRNNFGNNRGFNRNQNFNNRNNYRRNFNNRGNRNYNNNNNRNNNNSNGNNNYRRNNNQNYRGNSRRGYNNNANVFTLETENQQNPLGISLGGSTTN